MDRLRTRLLAAAVVALIVAAPFLLHLFESPGRPIGMELPNPAVRGDSDAYQGVWHHWWVATAILDGVDPRWCCAVFHPRGVSLVYDNVGWVDCVALLPLSRGFPAVAYNMGLLLNSILVALGVYALSRSMHSRRHAAMIAALLAALMPVRLAHLLQHYQIAAIGWTALALAAVLRVAEGSGRKAALLTAAVVLAGLAMLQSPYHYLFILVSIAMLPLLAEGRADMRRWWAAAGAVLVGGVPAIVFYLTGAASAGIPEVSASEAVLWAAEPQSLLLPSPFGVLGRALGTPAAASWMPNAFEGIITPGLTVLAAAGIWVVKTRRWRVAAAACIMLLLAMGPQLKILGRVTAVPLPFRLLQMVPFGEGFRSPARFALVGGMLACVLAGRWMADRRGVARAVIVAAVLLEVFPVGLPSVSGHIPEVYRSGGGNGPVLELPVSQDARRPIFFQTADGRPRYAVFLTRRPQWAESYMDELRALVRRSDSPRELLEASGATLLVCNRWLQTSGVRIASDSILPDDCRDSTLFWTAGGQVKP